MFASVPLEIPWSGETQINNGLPTPSLQRVDSSKHHHVYQADESSNSLRVTPKPQPQIVEGLLTEALRPRNEN